MDYGVGNVRALLNIYKSLNIAAVAGSRPVDIERADKLILPGVGAFDWAMSRLNTSGLRETLDGAVGDGRPVLGICVGMQMMAESSEEGKQAGLGWIPGTVKRFNGRAGDKPVRLPHMGWNDIATRGDHFLFRGLPHPARFYFLHSYYFAPTDDATDIAGCEYQDRFTCAVSLGNILGVQFHPEKSHGYGVGLLRNFATI